MIEKYSRAYAAIDLDAIRCNIEGMASKLTGGTKIIAVIKADGYGHGAVPIAKELEPLKDICGFAAATEEEAIILRMAGITKSILVLGYTFPYSYKEMVEKEISIAVFRHDTLMELSRAALEAGKKAKIHIKVDTGMARIGIRPDEEGMKLVSEALEMPGIEIEGIFTHFARADEKDKTSARRQLSLDAVRAGIAMYGLWPSQEVSRNIVGLKPAMELKSRIIYVKDVEAGAEIGYGGTFTASRKMKIATVPVGYGDGYPRGLSNKGYVLVHGKKAPIAGRICMDQFMIDVTQIPEIKEGDVATLIGREGELEITMEELGELSGRFNYELACCIGKRIPRVYLKSGKMVSAKDYFHDFE